MRGLAGAGREREQNPRRLGPQREVQVLERVGVNAARLLAVPDTNRDGIAQARFDSQVVSVPHAAFLGSVTNVPSNHSHKVSFALYLANDSNLVYNTLSLNGAQEAMSGSKKRTSYSDLLRDPRWQRKRLDIMNRSDFTCEECGDGSSTLNVHHIAYQKGRMPWDYEDSELRCLCETCHKAEHGLAPKKPKPAPLVPLTLQGGPCDGQVIESDKPFPLVWVYEKGGQLITALDFQQTVLLHRDGEDRLIAGHFFGRGHPYMYSTMYGPEKHAEFTALWRDPYPVLVGVYGLMPVGHWAHIWSPAVMGGVIPFRDPDALLLHIDSLFNLLGGTDFDETPYWNEDVQ